MNRERIIRLVLINSIALVCGLLMATQLCAQSRAPTTAPPLPTRTPAGTEPEVRAREVEIESARKKDPRTLMAEVNEDLQRLSAIGEELTGFVSSSAPPDYKRLADAMTETRKHAVRLRADLVLPASGKEDKRREIKDPNGEQLNDSVSMLKNLIEGFVHNPIFSDTGAIDQQLAAKARRDLDDIISLSEKIRKSASKLRKSAEK